MPPGSSSSANGRMTSEPISPIQPLMLSTPMPPRLRWISVAIAQISDAAGRNGDGGQLACNLGIEHQQHHAEQRQHDADQARNADLFLEEDHRQDQRERHAQLACDRQRADVGADLERQPDRRHRTVRRSARRARPISRIRPGTIRRNGRQTTATIAWRRNAPGSAPALSTADFIAMMLKPHSSIIATATAQSRRPKRAFGQVGQGRIQLLHAPQAYGKCCVSNSHYAASANRCPVEKFRQRGRVVIDWPVRPGTALQYSPRISRVAENRSVWPSTVSAAPSISMPSSSSDRSSLE